MHENVDGITLANEGFDFARPVPFRIVTTIKVASLCVTGLIGPVSCLYQTTYLVTVPSKPREDLGP